MTRRSLEERKAIYQAKQAEKEAKTAEILAKYTIDDLIEKFGFEEGQHFIKFNGCTLNNDLKYQIGPTLHGLTYDMLNELFKARPYWVYTQMSNPQFVYV